MLSDFYGKAMAQSAGMQEEMSDAEMRGWIRAVRYGLLYLAHLGLAMKWSDTTVTYNISEYGKQVIQSPKMQQRFKESFEKDLLPLRA